MKITLIVCLLFGCISYSSAQTALASGVPKQTAQNKSFDDFVNENALTIVTVGEKEMPAFKGEVTRQQNLLLSEYKLTVLDEEAQYYKIKGENKLIKVASMYRLKVMFESQKNIKSYE